MPVARLKKLFPHDLFRQRGMWVVEELPAYAAVFPDVDAVNLAHLHIVRRSGDRPLVRVHHPPVNLGVALEDGALPSPRAERTDRSQGQDIGVREDGPVGREVICGASCRSREQHTIADQAAQSLPAVDANNHLAGLLGFAEEGHLIDSQVPMNHAIFVRGDPGHRPEWSDVIRRQGVGVGGRGGRTMPARNS